MLVYGRNVLKELLNSNIKINKIILSNNFSDIKLKEKVKKYNIEYKSNKDMDKIVNGNHQGVIIEIEDYKYYKYDDIKDGKFIVILDHLEDPHNFGAIIRTCESAGVDGIIIPKNRSVSINATVMKVSVGALNNMKIVEVNNLSSTIDKLKKDGFWVYGTDMENSYEYTKIEYDTKVALVIGAEGNGIGRLVRDKCDFVVNIPMYGKINSLNASVAAGIIIYEIVRQKRR